MTKLILYKTLILPVLLYGAEAWTLLSTDAATLRVFERKILRKIYGPVRVGDDFRAFDSIVSCMSSSTTWTLCSVLIFSGCAGSAKSFVWRILRRDGYLMRVSAEVGGRPCIRWKDQIEEALSSIGVTNWRRRARNAWKDVLRQAEIR